LSKSDDAPGFTLGEEGQRRGKQGQHFRTELLKGGGQ
jgi:hypothetical protein